MIRFFCFLLLFSLSLNLYAIEFFDSKVNFDKCIDKLESDSVGGCKFNLSEPYQYMNANITREQANKIQITYNHHFYQILDSEEERVNFSFEVISFLANKGIIKPFILLHKNQYNEEKNLSVVIPINGSKKGGYGIPLTFNKSETLVFINLLEQKNKKLTKAYSEEIKNIFSL